MINSWSGPEMCPVCGCDIEKNTNFVLKYEGKNVKVHSQACVDIGAMQLDYEKEKE